MVEGNESLVHCVYPWVVVEEAVEVVEEGQIHYLLE
jgi:hypothetical protein